VWFLGGTFSDNEVLPGVFLGQVSRDCTIPSGIALFFPLVDAESSTLEGNGDTGDELLASSEFFASFIDPDSLSLEIDGKPVTNLADLSFDSPEFTFGPLPDNNVLGLASGATTPSVSDGYFAMVKDLSVGQHVLHWTGTIDLSSIDGPVFIQDVTYHLTVVPAGQYKK
jgi:hypothetical protein